MGKHRRATAWLCWMPAFSWPDFLLGQYGRKLPWPKCFVSMSLTGTGFRTTRKTGSLPAMLLLWPLVRMACLVCKSAREGRRFPSLNWGFPEGRGHAGGLMERYLS